jgi:GTP-binding protein HflX
MLQTTSERERAILVGVALQSGRERAKEYIEELALLADSAGAEVVARLIQERHNIDAAFYIGKGKAEEIAFLVEEKGAQLVIFDDDLSAVQVRNLQKLFKCKILDRSGMILDIFASRARTREAKTQVELAQLQYMLPRLTRQWTHLSKQYGGIGTKGPGETQIETDRRALRTRISILKEKLAQIDRERAIQRNGREHFTRVALVGYTNAGKSTILNWFSAADVLVEDRLFATLDSTVRLVKLSPVHVVLLSDTVGFIRKLPHHLVASFTSTLDEVREADILLHVVDVSHPLFEEQMTVVDETLEEIGATGKPVVLVFNKIDALANRNVVGYLTANHPDAAFVSATRGIGMNALQEQLIAMLDAEVVEQEIVVSHRDYAIIARIHEAGHVLSTEYEGEMIRLRFRMRKVLADRILKSMEAPGTKKGDRRRRKHPDF